jgi:hypothetical protein
MNNFGAVQCNSSISETVYIDTNLLRTTDIVNSQNTDFSSLDTLCMVNEYELPNTYLKIPV